MLHDQCWAPHDLVAMRDGIKLHKSAPKKKKDFLHLTSSKKAWMIFSWMSVKRRRTWGHMLIPVEKRRLGMYCPTQALLPEEQRSTDWSQKRSWGVWKMLWFLFSPWICDLNSPATGLCHLKSQCSCPHNTLSGATDHMTHANPAVFTLQTGSHLR